jgi:hypothetical protein
MTTAAVILDQLKRVDGKGSGLDTDLVRGRKPGAYGLFLLEAENAAAIDTGDGMLPGGATGQVLMKISSTSYDVKWDHLKSVAYDGNYWSLENIPTDFNPRAHQHVWSDLTSFPPNISSLAALSIAGMLTRLSSGQITARTIVSSSTSLAVTDGAGAAGNPSLSLSAPLQILGQLPNGSGSLVNDGSGVMSWVPDGIIHTVVYNEAGSPLSIFTVPAGFAVDHIVIVITATWNGTGATLSVGADADPASIMILNDPADLIAGESFMLSVPLSGLSVIKVAWLPGSGATTGSATIQVVIAPE